MESAGVFRITFPATGACMMQLNAAPASDDERIREVASILATGILRLRSRVALSACADPDKFSENPENIGPTCLEVPDETVLSGDNGVYGFREPE